MHFDDPASPSTPTNSTPWYKLLTRYHWFVLTVAALGLLFDTMDQQLFVLARPAAMKELVVAESREEDPKCPFECKRSLASDGGSHLN